MTKYKGMDKFAQLHKKATQTCDTQAWIEFHRLKSKVLSNSTWIQRQIFKIWLYCELKSAYKDTNLNQ